ncbi:hypothetical protein ACFXKX_35420 [Streptomyces scopuliridis]|uniref:hypothetical protein n=1 Tax=Streptomyces scopuliridis TaxID=452529 RepID=UPI0036AC8962
MSAVVVVVTIIPVPEHRSEVIAALERAINRAHVEDEGCLLYALHEGDDPRSLHDRDLSGFVT